MPHRSTYRLFLAVVLIALALNAPAAAVQAEPARHASMPQSGELATIYLPIVTNLLPYTGRVTYLGMGVANQTVDFYWTADEWFTSTLIGSAVTDTAGFYRFDGLFRLADGQRIGAEWINPDMNYANPYLSAWFCDDLRGQPDDQYTCNIEIQDVVMDMPRPGATIYLPSSFSWGNRLLPGELYSLDVWDPETGAYLDTPLVPAGINMTTVSTLPAYFAYGYPYHWSVSVFGPENGFGFAYYYREVTFGGYFSAPLAPAGDRLSEAHGAARRSQLARPPAARGAKDTP